MANGKERPILTKGVIHSDKNIYRKEDGNIYSLVDEGDPNKHTRLSSMGC